MKRVKRCLSLILVLSMVLGILPAAVFAVESELPFTDVKATDWYYDAVQYVYEEGMMSGTSRESFSPKASTTRGMIVTILHRLEGKPVETGVAFDDVAAGAYYADAVAWASANGIVDGYGNGSFGPNDPITREQLAVILHRYAAYRGLDSGEAADLSSFADAQQVSQWAESAMRWAYGEGMISGLGDGILSPKGAAARAQVAAILMRLCEEVLWTPIQVPDREYAPPARDDLEEDDSADEDQDDTDGELPEEDSAEVDEDTDGLEKELEEYFGASDDLDDTDGDGINDYTEIVVIGSDPNTADGELDADGDALTNYEEVNTYQTNPVSDDSDYDGLSDGEEVLRYRTDPLNHDTDHDNIMDGDEIDLGQNPLVVSDITKINQELDDAAIDPVLLEENEAVPSVTGFSDLVLKRSVSLEKTHSEAIMDNRAMVGCGIDMTVEGDAQLTLAFEVAEATDTMAIMSYSEEAGWSMLHTTREGSSLEAEVSESGLYCVMDLSSLLHSLGVDADSYYDKIMAEYASAAPMLMDNGMVMESVASQMMRSGAAMGQADIVFVIDTTGSMSDEIRNVANNVINFAQTLMNTYYVNANLALIDYRDITADGKNSTKIIKNGTKNWFTDVDDFKNAVLKLDVNGGGDNDETAVDALEAARNLDYRSAANKFIVLVTDAGYKVNNNYGISSMEEEIKLLQDDGIVVSVVTSSGYQNAYYDLYNQTGGIYANIYGNFSAELLKLADLIGEEVNQGNWILLDSYQYISLKEPLSETSGSTDEDDWSDFEELGTPYRKCLTEELKKKLLADGVPAELIEAYFASEDGAYITVYPYKSHPLLPDTDFDGTNDDEDERPKNSSFTGKLHYELDKKMKSCEIEFVMDYSLFFGDNEKYTKDLSVLSVLYSADIYEDSYVEVTGGAKGGADDGTSFGKLLGLQNPAVYVVDQNDSGSEDGRSTDADDKTDIFVGHRNVEYNGEEMEIFVLSVRGTNGTSAEWSSNFDVGADTDEYYALTGAHPDWKNLENHKGFDVTAYRVKNQFDAYLHELISSGDIDANTKRAILITGHSRGAAVANLLGAWFENDPLYKSFTYTFAAPYSTTDPDAESYKTIKNIVNKDDIIPQLPLSAWEFKKYGTIHDWSIKDQGYESKSWKDAEGTWEWLVGYDYNPNGNIRDCLDAFEVIAKTREELYVMDTSSDGTVNIGNKYHTSKDGVNARAEEVKTYLEEQRLLRFCQVKVDDSGWPYHVAVTYCPAYLMQNLANMASHSSDPVGPKLGTDTKGKYADAKFEFGLTFVSGMTHPHMTPAYYLLAHNNFKALSK